MQKTDTQASILMWTVFLSMILAMTFLSISTQIHNTIKNSGDFVHSIDSLNQINTLLVDAQASQNYTDQNINDAISIDFEHSQRISRSLQTDTSTEIKVLEPVSNNDISINISSGGPLIYEYRDSTGVSASGAIIHAGSFNVTQTGSLFLQNIGAHAHINIASSASSILAPKTKYSIYRKIGNLNSLQTKGSILNFSPLNF